MQETKNQIVFGIFLHVKTPVFQSYRVVGHPAMRILPQIRSQLSKTSQSTLYNIFKCTGDQNVKTIS
jgi:hypothetical protein